MLLLSGGLAGLAGAIEVSATVQQLQPVISAEYGFTAIIVAFLGRLNPAGAIFGALVLAVTYIGGENAQIALQLPKNVTGIFQGMLLFFLLACDTLIRYRIRLARPRRGRVMEAFLISVMIAATPFLFAGMGELVAERSGVLNLGVEGMMLVGAVVGLRDLLRAPARRRWRSWPGAAAGAALALVFAVISLTLLANQAATGLALTIFGIGASGLIGQAFVGQTMPPLPKLSIPVSRRRRARRASC